MPFQFIDITILFFLLTCQNASKIILNTLPNIEQSLHSWNNPLILLYCYILFVGLFMIFKSVFESKIFLYVFVSLFSICAADYGISVISVHKKSLEHFKFYWNSLSSLRFWLHLLIEPKFNSLYYLMVIIISRFYFLCIVLKM